MLENWNFVGGYYNNLMQELCHKTGRACPHWIDYKIVEHLQHLDSHDDGTRVKEYLDHCHVLAVRIKPPQINSPEWEFSCHCHPYDPCSSQKCSFQNPEALRDLEANFLELINDFQKT